MSRTKVTGPAAGGYTAFTVTRLEVAAGVTDLYLGEINLPFACRVHAISLGCSSSTGGASRGTIQITDGTNDLIASDALLTTADSILIDAASSPALVAAQRTRTRLDKLHVFVTTVASEVVDDLVVVMFVASTDQIQLLSTND